MTSTLVAVVVSIDDGISVVVLVVVVAAVVVVVVVVVVIIIRVSTSAIVDAIVETMIRSSATIRCITNTRNA